VSAAHHLHLSLGPVQGFVAEARRARDLWAGSFLLAWLTMRALRAIEQADGKITSPLGLDQDPAYLALGNGGKAPYRATVPNRIAATFVDAAAAEAGAAQARAAIEGAWEGLAESVRAEFLEGVLDATQQAIWEAEIGPPHLLWEIHWVVVPDGVDGYAALERRKLWRDFATFPDAIAGGDRCRLMHDWRELSGASRVSQAGRQAQEAFWAQLHVAYCKATGEKDDGRKLELRDREWLSAPALVKRLFPRLPVATLVAAIGWTPGEGVEENGRWRPSYMPSTAYMAIVHWLARAVRVAPELCAEIQKTIAKASPALAKAERAARLAALDFDAAATIREVDGTLFFAETLENARELGIDPQVRQRLAELLRQLYATPDRQDEDRPLGAPSSYYAILRMDGDEMGKRLQDHAGLAAALPAFTRSARAIVEGHSGRLLYAGADDLLALLPLEGGIAAAIDLEAAFRRTTAPVAPDVTISAGLAFVHQNAPLRAALRESQRLLDAVAKEVNGRASLAASVYRVGGTAFEWATTWRAKAGHEPLGRLQDLLDRLYHPSRPTRALASNRLTSAMRERLGPYFTEPGARRQAIIAAPETVRAPVEVVAGLVRAAGGEALRQEVEDADITTLLDVAVLRCRQVAAEDAPPTLVDDPDAERCLDLFLLLRFLASQWRKR